MDHRKIIVLTGVTRGLGRALVPRIVAAGHSYGANTTLLAACMPNTTIKRKI